MTSPPVDQLIDHAADLQQQVDRLWSEVLLCQLMIFALAVLFAVLVVRLRQAP